MSTACDNEEFNPVLTEKFILQSSDNGASYTIKVGLPVNYNPVSEKYATIYVLDGEEDFDFVTRKCGEISDKYDVDNVLVVSIGYGKDRSIDYTPTAVSSKTGGGPAFLHFIESQIIPKIEQNYSVDTTRDSRVLVGHSYGGLFEVYAFSVKNEVFGNYIMLSPSLWFDNLVALQLEKDNRDTNRNRRQLVFMGIGEAENSGRMQAPFEAFYQTLRENYSNLKLTKNSEKNLDHNGSKYPNIDKGLNYYFQNR
ncbi:alpha/beta hydrolase [Flavobacterium sp. ZS1P14]|uniref:alpha/beta hydrolase n=1 Tax=Flavobacterium sp. ZS1P14 TaxID=3401729 RepID=UPI003AB07FA4